MIRTQDVEIEEFLYPKYNTLRLDGETIDGNPYQEGVNLLGKVIPQYQWDMEAEKNVWCFDILPGERMVVGKQEQFYDWIFKYSEVFFGGARGGAKTFALLKSHILKHLSWYARGIKGQTTAMFAETKEEILRRHVNEFPNVYPKWLGWWDAQDFIFNLYPKFGGGRILFLYIGRKDTDVQRLLSYQMAYITVEELTRNNKEQYLFISSCLRSTAVPANEWCVASASNPGSRGHKWVHKRFVKKKDRERAQRDLDTGKIAFIQSLPMDNPLLPKFYWEKQLAKLSPKNAAAYRDGDWTVFEGQFFDMLDERIHIIPKSRVPDTIAKYMGIDIGTNHPTGCVWLLHYPPTLEHPRGKLVVYRYYERKNKWPSRHKQNIWELMKDDKNVMRPVPLSHDAFGARQSTEGDLTIAERFNTDDEWGPSFDVVESSRDKKTGLRVLLDLLSFEEEEAIDEDTGALYYKMKHPPSLYFMDTPEVRELYTELSNLVHKDGDSEDCEGMQSSEYDVYEGDEGPDSLRYAIMEMGAGVLFQEYTEAKTNYNHPYRDMPKANLKNIGYASFTM